MLKFEESLDLVLQTLIDNNNSLCIFEVENVADCVAGDYTISHAYVELFSKLDLEDKDAIELFELLKGEKYIDFKKVTAYEVAVKVKADNSIGNRPNTNNELNEWGGKPDKITITLQGKFFIHGGGYTGKHKKEKRDAILKILAIWITALGTGISGLYFIGKFVIWLYHNFMYF